MIKSNLFGILQVIQFFVPILEDYNVEKKILPAHEPFRPSWSLLSSWSVSMFDRSEDTKGNVMQIWVTGLLCGPLSSLAETMDDWHYYRTGLL